MLYPFQHFTCSLPQDLLPPELGRPEAGFGFSGRLTVDGRPPGQSSADPASPEPPPGASSQQVLLLLLQPQPPAAPESAATSLPQAGGSFPGRPPSLPHLTPVTQAACMQLVGAGFLTGPWALGGHGSEVLARINAARSCNVTLIDTVFIRRMCSALYAGSCRCCVEVGCIQK